MLFELSIANGVFKIDSHTFPFSKRVQQASFASECIPNFPGTPQNLLPSISSGLICAAE